MSKETNISKITSEVTKENLEHDGKRKNLYRTTSDNLSDIFSLGLNRGNVIVVDGLKYRFDGKDKFIIDKNAKKSSDLQGREYDEMITLHYVKGPYIEEQMQSEGWQEIERRSCTIKEIYEYPIISLGSGKRRTGHGLILKPDRLNNYEAKEFIISKALDDVDVSYFKVGQKVWDITYKKHGDYKHLTTLKD